MTHPLTANSTLRTWFTHEEGGPRLRQALTDAGIEPDSVAPLAGQPLQQLIAVSGGRLPQSVVDDIVRHVNSGDIPIDTQTGGWTERPIADRFAEHTVIVTGAGGGIGRATASRIAREGGRVVAVDINGDGLADLVAAHPDLAITAVAADITDIDDVNRIVAATDGVVTGLANVAGINDDFSPLHETSDATWDRVLRVNLTGTFQLTRAVLPAMLATGRGAVVNVTSEAGLRGNASGNAYTVSKHAVIGLTRSAAFMYGPSGIRVNAVAPGGVATGIPFPENMSATGAARLAPFQRAIPTLATAAQLAASITYLLCDDSININGAILPSDGGWSVQ